MHKYVYTHVCAHVYGQVCNHVRRDVYRQVFSTNRHGRLLHAAPDRRAHPVDDPLRTAALQPRQLHLGPTSMRMSRHMAAQKSTHMSTRISVHMFTHTSRTCLLVCQPLRNAALQRGHLGRMSIHMAARMHRRCTTARSVATQMSRRRTSSCSCRTQASRSQVCCGVRRRPLRSRMRLRLGHVFRHKKTCLDMKKCV